MIRRTVTDAARQAAAAPISMGFAAMLWLTGLATGTISAGPGPGLLGAVGVGVPALRGLHWWSPITAALWCSNWVSYLAVTALLLGICVPLERRVGSRRAVALFLASQIVGSGVALTVVAVGAATGEKWTTEMSGAVVVSPMPGLLGVALAASAALPPLSRRRIQLLLSIGAAMLGLYSGQLSDVVRLFGGLVGWVLGRAIGQDLLPGRGICGILPIGDGPTGIPPTRTLPTRTLPTRTAPTLRERRALVALLVAASALGPLVAVIGEHTTGPFSLLQSLLLSAPPEPAQVQAACLDLTDPGSCRLLQAQSRLTGPGSLLMSILPVLLLLTLAEGLRRGRKFACYATVAANLALAVLGALLSYLKATELADGLTGTGPVSAQTWVQRAVPVLLPLLIALLVFRQRDRFAVTAPQGTYRRMVRRVAFTGASVSAFYVAAGSLVRSQFDQPVTAAQLLADLPGRLIPPGYLGLPQPAVTAVGGLASGSQQWIGVGFWVVVLGTTVRSFWLSRIPANDLDATRAKKLVIGHGAHSLSYMSTWAGNRYWFTDDQRSTIAYRVVATVALTIGDPVGPADQRAAAIGGFADHCQINGYTPCLYSVTGQTAELAGDLGWKSLHIAEDAVIGLGALHFTGRKWQDVRTALNRAARSGITARWTTYPTAGPQIAAQIDAIAASWIADKQLPEMGFTLGGLRELDDPRVRCLLAVDGANGGDDKVLAVTSWLPTYRDGQVTGWTLDFMRRAPQAPPGVMEFLIATAALQFQSQGAESLSLSGAPLARLTHNNRSPAPNNGQSPTLDDDRSPTLHKILDILADWLEPAYGFRSLLAFKAKFQPDYSPLYLTYPDPADLPAIANAIGRAYLPGVSGRDYLQLGRRLIKARRGPGVAAHRKRPPDGAGQPSAAGSLAGDLTSVASRR